MSRDRYRAVARHTGVYARLGRRGLPVNAALLALAVSFVVFATPRVAAAAGTLADDLGARVALMFPSQGTGQIDLPTGAPVAAEPVAQGLPDFTREPALTLHGRVPVFALLPGRTVEVSLNGVPVAEVPPDDAGLFTTPLTLRDGPNALVLLLLSGSDVISRSAYTVVLDREAPQLSLSRPQAGESVVGPNVVVEGRAEPGATVMVNERTIVLAQDGSFSDMFAASPGPLTITVVARDRAGNETKAETGIVVRPPSSGALALSVSLDKTRARPGEWVIALTRVTQNGVPKAGQQVTLQVGVITIASAFTDAQGLVGIGFAAPPHEGDAAIVVLSDGASARTMLSVRR